MLPSRERALKGMDYVPKNYNEAKAEQDLFLKKKDNDDVKVTMWRMDAAKYTQVEVTYRGVPSIVCIAEDAPSNDPDDIAKAIKDFYKYVDLEKTAIFKKASSNDKTRSSTAQQVLTARPKRKPRNDGDSRTLKPGNRRAIEDEKSTVLGMDCNNIIYKERVLTVFRYAEKRRKNEALPDEKRREFSTNDICNDIFAPIYKSQTETTVRNKTMATLRYMTKQGWLKQRQAKNRLAFYTVLKNPFEKEMPAQAEFDTQQQKNTMRIELDAMRRNEDGLKC